MTSTGQPRRQYDSSGRRAQAAATRERILASARELFLAKGFASTSIAEIAAGAGVSAPTVFAGFRTKVNLLKEVFDTSIAGDAEAVAMADRPEMRHVHAGRTAGEVLDRYAALAARRAAPVHAVYSVVHRAADADPDVAEVLRTLDQQRLTGAGYLATTVCARLGTDDPDRHALIRDSIWTLISPMLYGLLVQERGWTVERYRDWLAHCLRALALEPWETLSAPR